MCYIVPAIMAAMAVGQQVMQHQAQQNETDAYNAAAAQTHENARVAAQNMYVQERTKYVQDSRAYQQESFQSALKKAAAISTAQAAAGAAGVTGISVDALMAAEAQHGEMNIDKSRDKMTASYLTLLTSENNTQAEANMRIAATPFKAGPGNLFLKAALAGGTAFAGGMAAGGQLGNLLSIGGSATTAVEGAEAVSALHQSASSWEANPIQMTELPAPGI